MYVQTKLIKLLNFYFMPRPFENVEAAAFENYDEAAQMFDQDTAEGFDDADNYGGKKGQVRKQRAKIRSNFDITFLNLAAVALNVELFNELNSFTLRQRADFINGAYTYLPLSTSPANLTALGAGTVGFLQDGGLYVRGADTATQLTLKCSQFPYSGLLRASGKGAGFKIISIRMTVTTDSQIDNEVVHTKASFLGSKSQNRISPRNFFRPEQFQGKIIDIPIGMVINAEHGIEYLINAGELVKWNIVIER